MRNFETIQDEYIVARWMYSVGEPIMDDDSYNKLHKLMVISNDLPEYTSRSWSSDPCPTELLRKYNLEAHEYKITLLDKTDSIPTLDSITDVKEYYRYYQFPVHASFKIDGFNTQPSYYRNKPYKMTTRGRSNDALDISSYLPYLPQHIDLEGEVRIVGELALSDDGFRALQDMSPNKNLISQRSSVRSALATPEARKHLTFLAFGFTTTEAEEMDINEKYIKLNEWGFQTPYSRLIHSFDELFDVINEMGELMYDYPFKTDGLVISSMDGGDLRALRVGAWKEPVYASIIKTYEESYGPSRIGVKLQIEPVRLEGSVQNLVNITNYAQIVNNGLFPGTPVAFKLRSQAIADIDEVVTRKLQDMYNRDPESTLFLIRSGQVFL